MNEFVFTSSGLFELLSQIDELKDKQVQVEEKSNSIDVRIGESVYSINLKNAAEVAVDEDAVEQVSEINDTVYDELADDIDSSEPVESGIIRNAIKSLLLGGIIRLVPDLMKK